MLAKRWEEIGIKIAPVFLILFIGFLPISTSLSAIGLVIGSLVLISTPYYRRISYYTWNSWPCYMALGLFVFVILAATWSAAPFANKLSVVSKYFKLFYLPIVATCFINPKVRFWALNTYLFSILVTCIISIGMGLGFIPLGPGLDPGEVFFNHIITGFMVSFACYLSLIYALQFRGWKRAAYLILFLLLSYQMMFISTGRTGYLSYALLMMFFIAQNVTKYQAIGFCILFSLFGICAYNSPTMYSQITTLAEDLRLSNQNKLVGSVGLRVEFHKYAYSLFKESPLVGIGTGGFKARYIQDNPLPKWGPSLTEPHSQYWFLLVDQGLIGFSLFGFFLWSVFRLAFNLQEMKPILLGFTTVFTLACCSDTIFSYSILGYLLVIVIAISFGELHERREAKASLVHENESAENALLA